MRLASAHSSYVSFGLNRPNAPNVFDRIPLRAGSLALSFTGATGMRSAGAAFSNRSGIDARELYSWLTIPAAEPNIDRRGAGSSF